MKSRSRKKPYGGLNRIYSCVSVADKSTINMMVSKGLLSILLESFKDCNEGILEHLLWIMCNIISEATEYKISFYEIGLYTQAINMFYLFKKSQIIRRSFSWLISNSMRCKPYLNHDLVS